MKTLLSKLKINKFTPLQMGFIASFVLHSALFAMMIDFNAPSQKSMKSQAINISLANIAGEHIQAQKLQNPPKKKHKNKKHKKAKIADSAPKIAESTPKPADSTADSAKNTEADSAVDSTKNTEADSAIDSAIDSAMDSTKNMEADSAVDSAIGASVNAGEKIEILGADDALYATILDIINNKRIYPKIAIVRKLKDNIQLEFILRENGDVQGLRVLSGRHRILNDNALDTIKRASAHFPKPGRSKRVRIMMTYDLI